MFDNETEDMPTKKTADQAGPITSLCALDKLFDATGTVEVKVGAKTVTLPIQSVDAEQVEVYCRPFRPKCPVKRDQIKGQWVTIRDEANQDYIDAQTRYSMLYAHAFACCGLAVDIRNASRELVWAVDNSTHDVEGAIKALKDMGLVLNHIVTINQAINALTTLVQEEQVRD